MSTAFSLGPITAKEIAEATGGKLFLFNCDETIEATSYCSDSREAESGSLFAAIKGERSDGHDFIDSVVKNGAGVVLCERIPEKFDKENAKCALIVVENTVKAIGAFAHAYKKKSNAKTVAITGSVGKTTTKEFVYAILNEKYQAHKSSGNHNNELGLPISIFEMKKSDEAAVFEMGMSNFGEIDYLSKMAEPDMALITTIGSSHLENLGTRENICKAKLEILDGLKKGGTVILNGDEPLLFTKKDMAEKPIFVAIKNPEAEFRAVNIRYGNMKTVFDVIYNKKVVTNIEISAMGQHSIYAALFAYAVGINMGLNDEEICRGLQKFKNADMRQNIYDVKGITVIEDCYNASPESMNAALDVMCELSRQRGGARTVAFLGDMRELGDDSQLMHHKLGVNVANKHISALFTYGKLAEDIASGAIFSGMRAENVYVNTDIDNPVASGNELLGYLKPGDILLVKASRAVAAEKVLEYVKYKIR